MLIKVTPHKVTIVEKEPVNEKEINISKCFFEFDDEITDDFVKEAYFTLNEKTYKQIIFNNECDFPHEVLKNKGSLEIGVVIFKVENEETIIRYNPSPDYFETWVGSLKDASNSQPITPSEMEQFEQELQDSIKKAIESSYINGHCEKFGDTRVDLTGYAKEEYVDKKIEYVLNNDIQTLLDLETEDRQNVRTNTNDINSLKSRITNVEEKMSTNVEGMINDSIQKIIDGDIANLTELITENQDNITKNRTSIKTLERADIKEFVVTPPFRDGLMTVNATTTGGTNIEILGIYNGVDGKYPYSALGSSIGQLFNERILALEKKVLELENALNSKN